MSSLRIALRSLSHRPGYALSVVALLALGLGASTGAFRAVDAVLFHPLSAPEPDRLVRILPTDEQHGEPHGNSSYPVFADYRDGATSFSGLAAFSEWSAVHVSRGGSTPERLQAGVASGDFFSVLGARPLLGRLFGPTDDRREAVAVAVLTRRAFSTRFGDDPALVGSIVAINGQPVAIVGVLEPSFRTPNLGSDPEIWMPAARIGLVDPEWGADEPLESRRMSWLDMIGRLAPGVSLATAQAELDAIAARRAAGQADADRDPWAWVGPASEHALDWGDAATTRRVGGLLLALTCLVLVAAAANAAGLALSRALDRRRELALRVALGATRRELVGSIAVECVALTGAALALSPLVARGALFALDSYAEGTGLPARVAAQPWAPTTLVFVAAIVAGTLIVAALLPAAVGSRFAVAPALHRDAVASLAGDRRRFPLRRVLVAAQAAIAMLLLIAAGLFARTLQRLAATPLGFSTDGVVLASVDFGKQGLPRAEARAMAARVADALAASPGIAAAGAGLHVPVDASGMRMTVRAEGYEFAEGEDEGVNLNLISPGYLAALAIPLVAGRDFAPSDVREGEPVAIVNRAFVERYLGGGEAVGTLLRDSGGGDWQARIVGVVGDVRERSLREATPPLFYLPHAQSGRPRTTLVARGLPGAESTTLAAIRAAVATVDPTLPVYGSRTLGEQVDRALAQERTLAVLVGAIATAAVGLAGAGFVALVALSARARRREFGIRAALGATDFELGGRIVRESVAIAGVGGALGAVGAWAGGRLIGRLLFGVAPLDPWAWSIAIAVLATAATLAALPSAIGAGRTEPATALRTE